MQRPISNPISRRFVVTGLLTAGSMAILMTTAGLAQAEEAAAILKAAFDNWRSTTSQTSVTMTIHRPTWERKLSMVSYSRGSDDSLVRFTAPAKDAGNATLTLGRRTWLYNPKLNQVVKLPASLLAQPWMGSDFSYSDLARSDDVLKHYTHQITGTSKSGGHTTYEIESIPKSGAPVVWGKQIIKVRDDSILMEVIYFDQDMQPVRMMQTDRIRTMGGRQFPAVLTMRTTESPDEWTRLETTAAEFDQPLPDYLFTKSNLSNPRD
ncbi:MAG: outer membrane lipoprotein-sorting protein [Paracoccaceae bacterium]